MFKIKFPNFTFIAPAQTKELRTRAKRDMDILVCVQDSMDKGKFPLPKFVDGRVPKHLATLNCPVLEVTANILHGRLIHSVFR